LLKPIIILGASVALRISHENSIPYSTMISTANSQIPAWPTD
jgi:hypothetical protein